MIKLGIVVPCYNEEDAFPETSRQLRALLDELASQGLVDRKSTITFIDDGSSDATWRLIEEAKKSDPRVSGIKLSGNCGHQNALLAGLLNAPGDALISLDADLQDDLGAIPKMLQAHAQGSDIVYGVRVTRDTDTIFKRSTAALYYWMLRKLGVNVVGNHADYRLMSRRAVKALASFGEVNLFLRGVIPLLGFPSTTVPYDRKPRVAGESKYPFIKMVALALNGVFSFSTMPLQWIAILGFAVAIGSSTAGLWALFIRLFRGDALPGWASTVIPMYFLGSVQLIALGVIGGYVSRIYSETKARPRFIVEKSI